MREKEKNSRSPSLGLRFRSFCSRPPLSQGFRNGFYHCTVSKMVLDKMSQWHCKDEICHLSSVISCVHFIWSDRTKYYLLASFVLHIKHSESKDSAVSPRILLSGPAGNSGQPPKHLEVSRSSNGEMMKNGR
ncbi:uncharacterized protein LOC114316071 isoform X5 [Camellia sinensis]|uniref:uncharacterized protein LOC114316071 isoform X5 n=1 Tax=Camellia sinensis TaxID=4442 RepID=UPI001036EFD1|nr:uncharacterized protein LOC114316071 isoform X5 [Camellia sinensis]